MVTLSKIYTRGGDKGQTSLSDGARVPKHDSRVASYGTVDEANSVIGIVRLQDLDPNIDKLLGRVQNDLFDVGADLATPEQENPAYPPLRVTAAQVDALEKAIDNYNDALEPLKSFILPGGNAAAAYLHLARTTVRRAERLVTELMESAEINPEALRYLNRLSDLMFVLARVANQNGTNDVLWVPGANRD